MLKQIPSPPRQKKNPPQSKKVILGILYAIRFTDQDNRYSGTFSM